jgi:flagellar basal body-associated protein FliL
LSKPEEINNEGHSELKKEIASSLENFMTLLEAFIKANYEDIDSD